MKKNGNMKAQIYYSRINSTCFLSFFYYLLNEQVMLKIIKDKFHEA